MTEIPFRLFLAALSGALLAAAPLHAQRGNGTPRVTLTGQVVDMMSGAPVAEATVVLSDIRAMAVTDSAGRFAFKAIPPGRHRFVVRRLGYAEMVQEVQINGGEDTRISILSKPMVLEGITVQADRLKARRNSSAVSVRVVERRDILASGARNAAELVATRTGLSRHFCPDGSFNCAVVRGTSQPIRVYIDDRPAIGGMEELETYATHELYAVESYGGGRMVRAYTLWFMENLAKTKRRLDPVFW